MACFGNAFHKVIITAKSCNGALSSGVAHSGSDNSLIARTNRAIKIAENFLMEEMTGRAIIASDESDRTSYTGPYSRHRSESFEYFRLCRSDHRHIGQPCRHVQERSLRPFQIQ